MTNPRKPAVAGDKPAAAPKTAASAAEVNTVDARERPPVHQTRAQDVRDPVHGWDLDRPWTPPSNLDAPTPRPGMAQRWVRVSIRAEDDPTNVARSFQEGWKPRPADTVAAGDLSIPTISHGRFAGYIGVHGLILCEMPAKLLAKRDAYYAELTQRQTAAVESDLAREADERLPITQLRRTRIIAGTKPPVQDDAPATQHAE